MIDTEVESAMRSNSGKKKKLSKGRRGRGDEERRRGKKKTHSEQHTTFFLKEEKFRVRSLRYPAPCSGAARGAEGEGRAPPLSAVGPSSVTSLIPPSSGFLLLCCCFLSGRKASSTFSFGKREQKSVLSPAAVSILSTSF